MGWGCAVKVRTELLDTGNAISYAPALPDADVLMIDGPAMTRSGAVGTRPAFHIAQHILKLAPDTTKTIIVCFDCPARVPAVRHAVHVVRAAAGPVPVTISDAVLGAATIGSLGKMESGADLTWPELFSTPRGKARAYELLFEAFKQQLTLLAAAKREAPPPELPNAVVQFAGVVTSPATGEFWSTNTETEFAPDLAFPYGEAEAQLTMCVAGHHARHPGSKINVLTIDTDILLQVGLTPAIDSSAVTIALARVWKNDDVTVRVNATGRKRQKAEQLTQQWELVCGNALAAMASRPSLFFYLAAGGVDYCGGLGGFGWPQKACIAIAQESQSVGIARIFADERTLDVAALAKVLGARRKSKRRNTDVAAFCDELDSLVFCWRYYMWQDATRPGIAGPEKQKLFKPFGATTIVEWLATASGTVAIHESVVL